MSLIVALIGIVLILMVIIVWLFKKNRKFSIYYWIIVLGCFLFIVGIGVS